MAARIRHIALCVKDIKATADFYEKAFGLKRTEIKEGKTAWNCYMSDGEVNLALLQYKGEEGSGVPKGWTGIHHFGFQCDDLPAQQKQIEEAGGKFFYDLGEPEDEGFERKFQRPERHRVRHQLEGLAAHQGQGEERQGRAHSGESACDETRRGGAQEQSARRPPGRARWRARKSNSLKKFSAPRGMP